MTNAFLDKIDQIIDLRFDQLFGDEGRKVFKETFRSVSSTEIFGSELRGTRDQARPAELCFTPIPQSQLSTSLLFFTRDLPVLSQINLSTCLIVNELKRTSHHLKETPTSSVNLPS